MHDWPICVIPYPIDGGLWSPVDQLQARRELGLPQDVPLILFTALAGTADSRKGADLLQNALASLARLLREVPLASDRFPQLVIIGADGSPRDPPFPFPLHHCGVLSENQRLRLHYAACDLLVIPSCQDSLPNTGLEAQACDLPVVGFLRRWPS